MVPWQWLSLLNSFKNAVRSRNDPVRKALRLAQTFVLDEMKRKKTPPCANQISIFFERSCKTHGIPGLLVAYPIIPNSKGSSHKPSASQSIIKIQRKQYFTHPDVGPFVNITFWGHLKQLWWSVGNGAFLCGLVLQVLSLRVGLNPHLGGGGRSNWKKAANTLYETLLKAQIANDSWCLIMINIWNE